MTRNGGSFVSALAILMLAIAALGSLTSASPMLSSDEIVLSDDTAPKWMDFEIEEVLTRITEILTIERDLEIVSLVSQLFFQLGGVCKRAVWAILQSGDPSAHMMLKNDQVSTGFTYILTVQNASGINAYLEDIADIVSPPSTVVYEPDHTF